MNKEIFDFAYGYKANNNDITWHDLAFIVNHKFGTNFSREGFRSAYRRKLNETLSNNVSVLPQAHTGKTAASAFTHLVNSINSFSDAFSGILSAPPAQKTISAAPAGLGRIFAEPVTMPSVPTLVLSDLHCPFHNAEYLTYAISQAKLHDVQQIAILGDIFDFDGISQWPKDHKTMTVEHELSVTGSVLRWLSDFGPITINMGNHDERLAKKLDNAISFRRVIAAALDSATTAHPITITDYDYVYLGNNFLLGHLSNYSKVAGKIAGELAAKHNRHVLVGHDHIHGVEWSGDYFGASIGCMAQTDAFWYQARRLNTMPDFVNGFAIVYPDSAIRLYRGNQSRTLHVTQYE